MVVAIFWTVAVVLWIIAEQLARNPGPGPSAIYCLACALVFVALAFYATRERWRLFYGLLELSIGIFILLGALNNYTVVMSREYVPIVGGGIFHRPPEGWLHWSATGAALLPVAAAVYILVRGLDNIGEGLEQLSPTLSKLWQYVFPKSSKQTAGNTL
jgi:hypothetical protein